MNSLKRIIDESGATKHEYLEKIAKGDLTEERMQEELLQRYLASKNTFIPFLAGILAKIPPTDSHLLETRSMLAKNLYEETGSGKAENAHLKLWQRLLRAIGFTQREIDEADRKTSDATNEYAKAFL